MCLKLIKMETKKGMVVGIKVCIGLGNKRIFIAKVKRENGSVVLVATTQVNKINFSNLMG